MTPVEVVRPHLRNGRPVRGHIRILRVTHRTFDGMSYLRFHGELEDGRDFEVSAEASTVQAQALLHQARRDGVQVERE